jgi:hypothetical protein
MKASAAILIFFGVGIVIWGAFGFTPREKVVDIGPIDASKDKQRNVPYGPKASLKLERHAKLAMGSRKG